MKNLEHVELELRDNDTEMSQKHEAMWNGTDWYQEATNEFAVYSDELALPYLSLGLASEAGEVAGKMKKFLRGDYEEDGPVCRTLHGDKFVSDMEAEIGDVFWYLAQLCSHLGLNMMDVMEHNISKLRQRKLNNSLKGSGDAR